MAKNGRFLINTTDGVPSAPVMHSHETYDLYYIEAGKREYFVEDKFFTAASGDFVLIKPTAFHRIGEGQVLRTLVSFTPEFFEETFVPEAVRELLVCFEKPLITPSEERRAQLQALLRELSRTEAPIAQGVLLARLLLMLNTCGHAPAYDKRLSAIVAYIEQNFADIRTIGQIAEAMYLSKQHLCRLFKKATGTTLACYINHIRVKNACTLLERSHKSLTQIAALCGFSNSAYFSTVFKATLGVSPSQYRRKQFK